MILRSVIYVGMKWFFVNITLESIYDNRINGVYGIISKPFQEEYAIIKFRKYSSKIFSRIFSTEGGH